MKKKYLLSGVLVAYLLAALSLLPTSGNKQFDFYKLSLRWPPSACNVGTQQCKPDTLGYFTIHGLWPTYANDDSVPPYDKKKNKCTDVTPADPKDLLNLLNASIKADLQKYWPNYKNYANINMCAESWKHEWKEHGMCADYPADKPVEYFSAALDVFKHLDYDPLKGTMVQPREEAYKAEEIISAVRGKIGATPEIQCNMKKDEGNKLQLLEIRLCFEKGKPPTTPINCTYIFGKPPHESLCKHETDLIKIPTPPKLDFLPYNQHLEL